MGQKEPFFLLCSNISDVSFMWNLQILRKFQGLSPFFRYEKLSFGHFKLDATSAEYEHE